MTQSVNTMFCVNTKLIVVIKIIVEVFLTQISSSVFVKESPQIYYTRNGYVE